MQAIPMETQTYTHIHTYRVDFCQMSHFPCVPLDITCRNINPFCSPPLSAAAPSLCIYTPHTQGICVPMLIQAYTKIAL